MTDPLRGLDAWIEGRHITDDPRSPYYTGPECICGDVADSDCPAHREEEDPDDARDRMYDEAARDWDDLRDDWLEP